MVVFNPYIVTMTSWRPEIAGHPGPRYRAIADAIAEDVAAGRLAPGTRLPTHRDLAWRLGVTVGTVTRAYAEAERRGLIGGEVGRGTFVRGQAPTPRRQEVEDRATPEILDLSIDQPSLGLLAEPVERTLRRLAGEMQVERTLRYHAHAGMRAQREAGARWLARAGISAAAERVIVTSGGQSGISLGLLAVAAAGDTVLVESLTYPGVKALAGTFGLRLQPVATDGDGLVPDAFEAACRAHRPRALYVMPNLHNPTLATMPEERRRRIAGIAREHEVTIVEDDVFGCMLDDPPPALAALAPGQTIHVTSLSKSLAPGLRIGFLTAPEALVARVEQVMRSLSWMASPLAGEVARTWIEDGTAERVAEAQRRETQARQALAAEILGPIAEGTPATAPHLWLGLPEPWRREEFGRALLRRGVKAAMADAFVVGRSPAPHAVRVNVTAPASRAELARGLEVVAELLARPDMLMLSVV
jgi:DNA-binding transcriptional MocR family regulator